MRTAFVAIGAALGLLGPGLSSADACSCVPQSPCAIFASAGVVFLGEVIDVQEGSREKTARLRVIRSWKQGLPEVVTIVTAPGTSASCSLDLAIGQRRVVYASESGGRYATGLCSGGGTIGPGDEEPNLPPPGGRVKGTLVRYPSSFRADNATITSFDREPIAGARIWIDLPTGRVDATTDGQGHFVFEGIPPGTHRVQADLGPGEVIQETRVRLATTQDCNDVYISTRPSGRLTGRLVDEAGAPLAGQRVYAIAVSQPWPSTTLVNGSRSGESREDGTYVFEGLLPGQYLVGVNLLDVPMSERPYLPTFHPGVAARDAATTFNVGQGEAAPVEPFVLRAPLPRTTMTAEVICKDGTRPSGASVSARLVRPGNHWSERQYKPSNGRWIVPLIKGYRYEVEGGVMVRILGNDGEGHTSHRTPAVIVDSDALPALVRLVSPLEKCDVPGGPILRDERTPH